MNSTHNQILQAYQPGSGYQSYYANQIYQPSTQDNTAVVSYTTAENTFAMAEYIAFCDKLTYALAQQAMSNTAMLATAEAHFSQIAPSGSDQYHAILQAYTKLAIAKFTGGAF